MHKNVSPILTIVHNRDPVTLQPDVLEKSMLALNNHRTAPLLSEDEPGKSLILHIHSQDEIEKANTDQAQIPRGV